MDPGFGISGVDFASLRLIKKQRGGLEGGWVDGGRGGGGWGGGGGLGRVGGGGDTYVVDVCCCFISKFK